MTSASARRPIRLVRDGFTERPALDTAVSHALLRRVADGAEPETIRIHRPARVLAFGPADRNAPGFEAAAAAAREQGFAPVLRLAGGRAAVFHEETISFAWAIPDPGAQRHITPRYELIAAIVAEAFGEMGIDARIGEVPGEYCPGQYSVNSRGERKLMGVGQRIIAGAAHLGGVIVVSRAGLVRDVLVPVNEALGVDWEPTTTGALSDEMPGLEFTAVEDALIAAFARRFDLEAATFSPALLAHAAGLEATHLPGAG